MVAERQLSDKLRSVWLYVSVVSWVIVLEVSTVG